jgi:hypothetical protein
MINSTPSPGPSPMAITLVRPQPHPLVVLCIVMACIAGLGVLAGFSTIAVLLLVVPSALPSPLLNILFPVSFATALPAIVGIIVGHIAFHRIKSNAGRFTGEQPATIGLILNYLCLIFAIINVIAEGVIVVSLALNSL